VVNRDEARGEWIGGELQFTRELFDRHKLVWGADCQIDFRQDQGNKDEDGLYLDDERESSRFGLFVQDEVRVLDNLILNAGVRRDQYSTFGGSTNPRVGLIYLPWEGTAWKLLYGRAFRTPSAYEFYYNDGGNSQKANRDLDPETIDTYEAVAEQEIGFGLKAGLSAFLYDIDDLINQTIDPADDLIYFQNIESVRAKGIETELEGRWENGWRAAVSYTFVDAEDRETHSRMTNSPRHLARLKLIAPLLEDRLSAGLETHYTGERKTLSGDDTHGYFLTHLTLFSARLAEGLELSAGVNNLFDKEYGHPGFDEHVQDILIQDGRSYWVKATYRF